MEDTTMNVEFIRERFKTIGIGSTLPRPGASWTRLGDHIHWLDMIGLGDAGFSLDSFNAPIAGSLLELAGCGVFPEINGGWLQLAMPIETTDPINKIIAGLSPRGRQGECSEGVVEAMRRMARRDGSMVEPLLASLRRDLQHRMQLVNQGRRSRIKQSIAICSCLIEFGTLDDLQLVCGGLAKFAEYAQVRIVCAIHARGWQREPAFLQALETLEQPDIHSLHEGFLRLREGGDLSDLDRWISSEKWMERELVLLGLHSIIPQAKPSQELLELLLPRIEKEDDSDCAIALGWALGAILEHSDDSAALEVIRFAEAMPIKEMLGFHSAMRALMRSRPSPDQRDALLQAMDPMVDFDDSGVVQSVTTVRQHLAQVPVAPWNLLSRFSERHGWLQDLAEPGRIWEGLIGEVIQGTAPRDVVLWLCIEPECPIPTWLRSHLLGKLLENEPEFLTVAEQASRPNDNMKGRITAAQALLMYPGPIETDPLYLACASEDLPTTSPEDTLRNAVQLLSWLNDPGLSTRALKLLHRGGPLSREVAVHWHSAMITNSFDRERVTAGCEHLVKLGVIDPPRPVGISDAISHESSKYRWSDVSNDEFLLGDVLDLDPIQLAMKLEPIRDLPLLEDTCRRIAANHHKNPELSNTAWERLNERNDWEGRKAALTLLAGLGTSFLQGRAGARRRERVKELMRDGDSDVSNAAKEICEKLESIFEGTLP